MFHSDLCTDNELTSSPLCSCQESLLTREADCTLTKVKKKKKIKSQAGGINGINPRITVPKNLRMWGKSNQHTPWGIALRLPAGQISVLQSLALSSRAWQGHEHGMVTRLNNVWTSTWSLNSQYIKTKWLFCASAGMHVCISSSSCIGTTGSLLKVLWHKLLIDKRLIYQSAQLCQLNCFKVFP